METRKLKINEPIIFEDEPIIQKNSCSLWIIFSFLFLIFLLMLSVLLYFKIKDFHFSGESKKSISNVQNEVTNQQLFLDKNSGESISLKINENELDAAVKSATDFPLKKPSLRITTEKIIISGKTSNNILGLGLEIGIVPKVDNGMIIYDIIDIKAAGVTAPKKISDQINQSLSQYLKNLIPSSSQVSVSAVKLFDKYIEVTGTKK